ncbi:MAG TPA: adenylate/guanylate cyclase domain-containing protein [Acidimicrobiia bacterium]|nr:adenylate/guanylate cyclase domain-containing protein [Acidimicrobiia bacterium]
MPTDVPSVVVPIRPGGRVRIAVWILHMALPLLALWLLIAQPDLDVRWQHRPSHFWLVMGVAAVNVALSFQVLQAARRRSDARVLLVGYAFMLAAGFLLLHALATPGVVVALPNSGFEIATPVGLALAAVFFALASLDYGARASQRIVAADAAIRTGLVSVMLAWGVVSVLELPPLAQPLGERAAGPLRWMAVMAIVFYAVASIRFFAAHRRRPSVLLVALITAAILLAEAMATIMWARNWQLSWWLWHLLMAAAFGFVAYSAYTQYQREGGSSGLFDGIVSRDTSLAIRQEYGGALETLTDTLQRAGQTGMTDEDLDLIITGLAARFSLTDGQTEVLARAARSLATERDQARRLEALAAIATETGLDRSEDELLTQAIAVIAPRFSPDEVRVGIGAGETTKFADHLSTGVWPSGGDRYLKELLVGGEPAGVVEFARARGRFRQRDVSIMDTLVAELGIAMDNARLYRQLDGLFRTYLSPDVAETLRADPSMAGLGGWLVEITALFADLRGFTSLSERTDPEEVVDMLNRYFGAAVPIVLGNGGTIVQFVGDALLAVFDAPKPRPDHEYRAAKSALAIQEAIADLTGDDADAPRFRMGINTGTALIGNVGSSEMRSFNVIGDAVNVAARLETAGEPGTVLLGQSTYEAIADRVEATPLGALDVKGKEESIVAFRLERLRDV